jgi:hypothetical protein
MPFLNPRYLSNTFSREVCHLQLEGAEPRDIPPHCLYSHGAMSLIAAVNKHVLYTRFLLFAFSGIATVLLLSNY